MCILVFFLCCLVKRFICFDICFSSTLSILDVIAIEVEMFSLSSYLCYFLLLHTTLYIFTIVVEYQTQKTFTNQKAVPCTVLSPTTHHDKDASDTVCLPRQKSLQHESDVVHLTVHYWTCHDPNDRHVPHLEDTARLWSPYPFLSPSSTRL